ncbi:lysozyme inhibitor LprI family protein [Chitinimonas taiwanensis]|nr:lysozyme inhibitor LprI family protein [Chitinimonas taiwanensis]
MRMLGVIFIVAFCVIQFPAAADEVLIGCESSRNSDILACLEKKRVLADKALNYEYKSAMARLNGENQIDLRNVQRKWIHFRDKFCLSVRKENGMGAEAGLEYSRCLYRITLDRKLEVQQLASVLSDEKFYSSIIALGRIGIERAQLIEKLAALDNDVIEWREYVAAHCDFMSALSGENAKACNARLNFNRSYQ